MSVERYLDWLFRHRWAVLVIIVLVTLFLGAKALSLKVDPSVETLILGEDPDVDVYKAFQKEYGGDDFIAVGYSHPQIFSPDKLAMLKRLSTAITQIPGVSHVVSLATLQTFSRDQGMLHVRPLLDETPRNTREVEMLKKDILSRPLLKGHLISSDSKVTVILAHLYPEQDLSDRKGVLKNIRKIVGNELDDVDGEFFFAGSTVLMAALERFSYRDLLTFSPVILFLLTLFMFLTYRNFLAVVLTLLVIILTLVWTMGLFTLSGRSMSMVTTIIPALLLAISTTIAVHFFYNLKRSEQQGEKAIRHAVKAVWYPCLMTTLTTAIGFSSLGISRIDPIRDMGIFSALGILITYSLSFTLTPLLLTFFRWKKVPTGGENTFPLFHSMGATLEHWKWYIVAGTTVVVLVALWGVGQIRVSTDLVGYFKPNTEIARSYRFFTDHLGGIITLEILVKGEGENPWSSPENLKHLTLLQETLEDSPYIGKSVSVADYLKDAGATLGMKNPKILTNHEAIAQVQLLFSLSEQGKQLFSTLMSQDKSTARISLRLRNLDSRQLTDLMAWIKERLKKFEKAGFQHTITGNAKLFANMNIYLIKGQIQSLLLAITVITLIMCLIFRSVLVAFLSMIPNLIPILLTLGLMGWLDIELNGATAMTATVALGIAVDDTIHFLVKFRKVCKQDIPFTQTINQVFGHVGRPIVSTSLILCLSFVVLTISNFIPTMYFGLLMGSAMLSALLGDLLILPVCLMFMKQTFLAKTFMTGRIKDR